MNSDDDLPVERRAAPRFQGSVYFRSGRVQGTGVLHDISLTGARVVPLTISGKLEPDAPVDLWVSRDIDHGPRIAGARVVWSNDVEFAVEFETLHEWVQELLQRIRLQAHEARVRTLQEIEVEAQKTGNREKVESAKRGLEAEQARRAGLIHFSVSHAVDPQNTKN